MITEETVIHNGSGSRICVAPRRNGDGLLLAQGRSHILLSNEELRTLAGHILEHLQ
jgi:hypothetical protein